MAKDKKERPEKYEDKVSVKGTFEDMIKASFVMNKEQEKSTKKSKKDS